MSEGIRHPFESPPGPGEVIEVAEGILWMRLPLPMALDHVNVYALDDGDHWTIVDTGIDSRKTRAIWQSLLTGPLKAKPVGRVIVTHHHPDHIGLAGWFQARGAELITTRTAWLYARMLVLDVEETMSNESLAFYRKAGLSDEALARKASERPFNFADIVHPLPRGFARIVEGSILRAGGRDWQVRIGHGHAPEHATLWSGDLVLGGDQLLPGISANIGVYPTEPEADPLAEWLRSCESFRPIATDTQLILPGHKLPFFGLPFRLEQMIENHVSALDRLLEHLAMPCVAADCFQALFKRQIEPSAENLALVETVAHLNHLLHKGEVIRQPTFSGAWQWARR